jgi:outer membrane protein assembly factor BamB
VTTAVTDGALVFTSGGYPKNHIAAVAADGSGEVVWENNTRAYVPSLLQRDGFLFATLDAGVASCFRAATGEEVWKSRLGGTFSSSPVMVGDLIYATNEEGVTHIFRANPEKFEKVADNKLGESVFATPAICGNRIYMRVAHDENGKRQEYLYCIGK